MAIGIDYNSGIPHTNGAPTHDPGTNGGKIAYDHVNRVKYKWVSGTTWEVDASGGGGGVESVTGDSVDNTDAANPVVNAVPYHFPDEMITDANNAFRGGSFTCGVVNFKDGVLSPNTGIPFFGIYGDHLNSSTNYALGFYEDAGDPFFILEASGGGSSLSTSYSQFAVVTTLAAPGGTYSQIVGQGLFSYDTPSGPMFTGTDTKFEFGVPLVNKKMTTSQRDALTPEEGFEIYNTTVHKKQVYDGTTWQNCW